MSSNDILTESFLEQGKIKRNNLIPLWIKIFSWIFLIFGILTPVALIISAIMHNFSLSLYGLEAQSPYSIMGGIITTLFLLKGIVAFGILRKEDWAINLGVIDAVIGIAVCIILMILPFLSKDNLIFRLELLILIPYLIKLLKVRTEWSLGIKN